MNPKDLLVALKIHVLSQRRWTIIQLAKELCISKSEVHRSIQRLRGARILRENGNLALNNLQEFAIHGVKYICPENAPREGDMVKGILTASSAYPLNTLISDPVPFVWASPLGDDEGLPVSPIHPKVPEAVDADFELYGLLTLIDALRLNISARVNKVAIEELRGRLDEH